ncbi:Tubulin-like protein CetZ [subsurface metagenome]
MKLVVVGFGQCGNRIAEEFSRLNSRARFHRRISILADAFAVNTDSVDLSILSSIKSDYRHYRHRILIGGQRIRGHGVGKVNELGAEIAREDGDKVLEGITAVERFTATNAFYYQGYLCGRRLRI